MSYVFKPEKSFIARLYWQEPGFIALEDWEASKSRVHRIGVGFDGEAPWGNEGWLFAGRDTYSQPSESHILRKIVFKAQFWFGCYETAGEYDYEIRSAHVDNRDRRWRYFNRRLDVSRNGYLGLYEAPGEVGLPPQDTGMQVWRLENFNPAQCVDGAVFPNVDLISLHGLTVKRLYESDYPYLNQQDGEPGKLALKILEAGVARPE
ncbi:hypothetical protein [Pseudomonas sp. R5(2019)]|uniref:hypothetical protein n=1 Tax=Pseudomonas sp. R5(2019) TaxID=2697566 RepID=UPI001411E7C5|nr:hypothetical protein [Pseudomonas sp. R5(2019)]NBA95915.1 hypothetical protein [Pseudomonas sp. R5(2019)]